MLVSCLTATIPHLHTFPPVDQSYDRPFRGHGAGHGPGRGAAGHSSQQGWWVLVLLWYVRTFAQRIKDNLVINSQHLWSLNTIWTIIQNNVCKNGCTLIWAHPLNNHVLKWLNVPPDPPECPTVPVGGARLLLARRGKKFDKNRVSWSVIIGPLISSYSSSLKSSSPSNFSLQQSIINIANRYPLPKPLIWAQLSCELNWNWFENV